MYFNPVYYKRFFAVIFVLFLLNSIVHAQTCSPCNVTVDLTVPPYSTGTTYTAAISPGANQTVCIIGPASGTAPNLNSTFNFNGVNNVCFSGKINILNNFTTSWGNLPILVFQAGSTITHSGTVDLSGGGWGNREYIYNYGSYSNTNAAQFNLYGTVLNNYGTFSVTGDLDLDPKSDPPTKIALNNYSTGVLTIGGKLKLDWGGPGGTVTNQGSLTAKCLVTSGTANVGVLKNPAGSTLTISGTDAACGVRAFDSGTTLTQVNGTMNVLNGTAYFGAASAATDLSGAKMYVQNFTVPAQTFNTSPLCLSIKATGLVSINSGSTYIGNMYIWDTSFDIGDSYGGSGPGHSMNCVLNGAGPTGCATVDPTYQTDMTNNTLGQLYYSATDNGTSVGCPTLPVTFVRFNVTHTSNGNQLTWTTAEEKNAQTFMVERSLDGVRFDAVGAVNAYGNATSLSNYQFIDTEPGPGFVYYRINEIDKDGTKMYSNIISIQSGNEDIAVLLGNPVREEIKIQLLADDDNLISLTNTQGDVVFEKSYSGIQQVNIKSQFAPGVYILKVSNDSQNNYMKVIIE